MENNNEEVKDVTITVLEATEKETNPVVKGLIIGFTGIGIVATGFAAFLGVKKAKKTIGEKKAAKLNNEPASDDYVEI